MLFLKDMKRHLADLELTMSKSGLYLHPGPLPSVCADCIHYYTGLLKEEGWMEKAADPNEMYTGVSDTSLLAFVVSGTTSF